MAPRKTAASKAAPGKPAARAPRHADIDAASVPLPPEEGFESEGGLFVFDATPIIRNWPAKVKVPVGGGDFRIHEIRLDLSYLDLDGLRELHEEIATFTAAGGTFGDPGEDGDPLMAVVHGWSRIAQQGKGELAYSEEAKSRLLADGKVRSAALDALARMVMGIEEKNSETPPAAGQPRPAGLNRAERRKLGKRVAAAMATA